MERGSSLLSGVPPRQAERLAKRAVSSMTEGSAQSVLKSSLPPGIFSSREVIFFTHPPHISPTVMTVAFGASAASTLKPVTPRINPAIASNIPRRV